MSITREYSYFFSSDPTSGAFGITPDGSSFSVAIPGGIRVPRDTIACDVGVIAASIWNDANNISQSFANNTFAYQTIGPNPGSYTITIPDGLYSLDNLQTLLSISFQNNGHSAGLFTLTGDNATSRIYLTIAAAGDSFNAGLSTISTVMGFQGMGLITAPSASYTILGNAVAAFNRVNSFIITTDLVTSGVPINSSSAQAIVQVPIAVSPGSQINYSPSLILWSDASHLVGQNRSNFSFQLRDQSLRPASTKEIWSITIVIRYVSPVINGTSQRIS